MPTQPKGPTGPTAPPLAVRVDLIELALVKLNTRLEETIAAQNRSAQSLGALSTLLADIASMEGGRVDDER